MLLRIEQRERRRVFVFPMPRDEDTTVGEFMTTLFGYNGNPSLLEFVAWASYLVIALVFFLRPLVNWRPRRAAQPA